MRRTLIELPRPFINLCLFASELSVVVEEVMTLSAQYLQVPRLCHIFGVERTGEDVR